MYVTWTDREIAEAKTEICLRIMGGSSLRSALTEKTDDYNGKLPGHRLFYQWLREDAEFDAEYSLARERQADALVDGMTDTVQQIYAASTPGQIRSGEQAIKVAMWRAERMAPKKWGNRQHVEMSNSIDVRKMSDAELLALLAKQQVEVDAILQREGMTSQ